MSKCLEIPHRGQPCREMFKDTGLRGLSSSDLTNVSQMSFCLTQVSCYHRIKCTTAAFLVALMWRRPLNSVFNHYRLQKTRKTAQIGQIFEFRVGWQTSGRWKWIGRDYIMVETLHKERIGKNTERETLEENYCSTVKN